MEVGSEELDASSGIRVEVGGKPEGAPEDGALEGGVSEALEAVLEVVRDRSSRSESTGGPGVAAGLGGCGGVGS